ncbi:hypothetical protein [Streptomyces sp. ML-6]|uniref:hypothetical protein n=1 Tax=Streptomyces sp. ML-6 TaxID=2982693 RepID=UPI0024C0C3DA|nr:hypothetical protein [Streptomyces sp. ML-6]MDK0525089.1 hypothetical protein [Streptomyces sp. ML-6]
MTDHKPETWFHEAGSDHCPHGAEPDRHSDAWNTWAEHHTGTPQDIFICLDAPIGPCCSACSEEFDEPISWEHCTQRTTAAPAVTEEPGR